MREFLDLFRFVLPHRRLLFLSIVFVFISAAIDLFLPYLVKHTIDTNIVPQVARLKKFPDWYGQPEGAFADSFVVLYRLPSYRKAELEKGGYLSEERYFIVRDSVEGVLRVGDMWIIESNTFAELPPDERSRLRNQHIRNVVKAGLLYMLLLVLAFVFNFLQTYSLSLMGQKSIYTIRTTLFDHLIRLPIPFLQKQPVGRLVTRVTNDVDAINEFYTSVLVALLKDFILIFGILFIMMRINPTLTMWIMLLIPFILAATMLFRKFARQAYDRVRQVLAMVNAFLHETISGIVVVQAFNRQDYMDRKFSRINDDLYRAYVRLIVIFGIFRPIINLVSSIAIALIIWKGGEGILAQTFTFGGLVAFISYVEMLFRPIQDLADKYNIMQSAFIASKRIFLLLGMEEERGGDKIIENPKGEIEFRNVWFAYEDENWVLKDISFHVRPGEKVAIVGPTGSGKSTIMNLLLRFWDVQRGSILYDGVDIRELDLKFLRRQFAIVLQDVFLFSGTIEDNIRLFSDISEEEIKKALSHVDERGMLDAKQEVVERGATLSAGQRQLVSFARAIAHDPKVILLDEATANVDQETEAYIQESLKKLMEGRTAIIIAHRLSTVREVDRILVLYYGRLIEEGSHEELMAKKGFYYHLYQLQLEV